MRGVSRERFSWRARRRSQQGWTRLRLASSAARLRAPPRRLSDRLAAAAANSSRARSSSCLGAGDFVISPRDRATASPPRVAEPRAAIDLAMVVPEAVWGAAYNGLLAPVQAWFDSGDRDANDLDQYRIPLLHRAFQSELFQTRWEAAKRADVVRYLVARGADVNRSSQLEFFNHGSYLHIVTSRWAEEDVQLLLELGADIAAKDPLLLVGYRVSKSKTRPPTPRRRTRGTWEPFASARATRRRRRRPRGGAPCAAARWRLRVGRPVAATAKGIAAAPRIVRGAASDPSVADRRSDGRGRRSLRSSPVLRSQNASTPPSSRPRSQIFARYSLALRKR